MLERPFAFAVPFHYAGCRVNKQLKGYSISRHIDSERKSQEDVGSFPLQTFHVFQEKLTP